MTLEINERERELLLELLQSGNASLLDELQHTDGYEYKEMLRQKFELLKELQSKIEAALAEPQAV